MKTLRLLGFVVLLIGVGCARDDEPRRTAVERPSPFDRNDGPILIVDSFSGNFWNSTPSSRLPRIVVYADGTVVYEHLNHGQFEFRVSNLSPDQLTALFEKVDVPAIEPFNGLEYQLTTATDAGRNFFVARKADGGFVRVSAYGHSLAKASDDRPPNYPPAPVENALRTLYSYSDPSAVRWAPPEFEVYIWECGPMRTEMVPAWPTDWPSPRATRPSKTWDTVRIKGTDADRVSLLLGTPVELHAKQVEHAGRVWCATYRPVFPQEEQWLHVIDEPAGPPN